MVNIAILQLRQYDNLDGLEYNEKVFEHIRKMIHDASYDHKIDVICMPELWYTKLVKDFEKEFRTIISAASEYNVTIIPGAFTEKIAGNVYVSCPVIASDRSILGRQFKIHLFGTQRKRYKSGSKIEIFDSGKFRFCVVICYDVVFPEIARSAAYNGVDMLFFPSKILKEGVYPWHMYLQVRALENRIPVIAANVCGRLFGGRSMVVDFSYNKKTEIALPKIKTGSSVREQMIIVNIDLKKSRQIRKKRFGQSYIHSESFQRSIK